MDYENFNSSEEEQQTQEQEETLEEKKVVAVKMEEKCGDIPGLSEDEVDAAFREFKNKWKRELDEKTRALAQVIAAVICARNC